jgi:DNA polymerase-3 subunit gamma/tau
VRPIAVTQPDRPDPPDRERREDIDPWRAILERVRAAKPAVASVLEHALPLEVTRERVVFGFGPDDSFLAARAADPEALDLLTKTTRTHFGVPTVVELRTAAAAPSGVRTIAAINAALKEEDIAKARLAIEKHPLVEEAIRIFGAQLRDVKLPGGEG